VNKYSCYVAESRWELPVSSAQADSVTPAENSASNAEESDLRDRPPAAKKKKKTTKHTDVIEVTVIVYFD